jgi:hypothetical protein
MFGRHGICLRAPRLSQQRQTTITRPIWRIAAHLLRRTALKPRHLGARTEAAQTTTTATAHTMTAITITVLSAFEHGSSSSQV